MLTTNVPSPLANTLTSATAASLCLSTSPASPSPRKPDEEGGLSPPPARDARFSSDSRSAAVSLAISAMAAADAKDFTPPPSVDDEDDKPGTGRDTGSSGDARSSAVRIAPRAPPARAAGGSLSRCGEGLSCGGDGAGRDSERIGALLLLVVVASASSSCSSSPHPKSSSSSSSVIGKIGGGRAQVRRVVVGSCCGSCVFLCVRAAGSARHNLTRHDDHSTFPTRRSAAATYPISQNGRYQRRAQKSAEPSPILTATRKSTTTRRPKNHHTTVSHIAQTREGHLCGPASRCVAGSARKGVRFRRLLTVLGERNAAAGVALSHPLGTEEVTGPEVVVG